MTDSVETRPASEVAQNNATNDLLAVSAYHEPVPPPAWQRGFWSLIVTQFQTGFNDNGLKFLVTYIVVAMNLPHAQRDRLVPIVGVLFAAPFILFSMVGGYFARSEEHTSELQSPVH